MSSAHLRPDDVVAAIRTIFERLPRLSRSARIRDLPAHERAALLPDIALEPASERPHRHGGSAHAALRPIADGRVAACGARRSAAATREQLNEPRPGASASAQATSASRPDAGIPVPACAEDAPRSRSRRRLGFVVACATRALPSACSGRPGLRERTRRRAMADATRLAAARPLCSAPGDPPRLRLRQGLRPSRGGRSDARRPPGGAYGVVIAGYGARTRLVAV